MFKAPAVGRGRIPATGDACEWERQFYLLLENVGDAADFDKLNFGFIAARLEDWLMKTPGGSVEDGLLASDEQCRTTARHTHTHTHTYTHKHRHVPSTQSPLYQTTRTYSHTLPVQRPLHSAAVFFLFFLTVILRIQLSQNVRDWSSTTCQDC